MAALLLLQGRVPVTLASVTKRNAPPAQGQLGFRCLLSIFKTRLNSGVLQVAINPCCETAYPHAVERIEVHVLLLLRVLVALLGFVWVGQRWLHNL